MSTVLSTTWVTRADGERDPAQTVAVRAGQLEDVVVLPRAAQPGVVVVLLDDLEAPDSCVEAARLGERGDPELDGPQRVELRDRLVHALTFPLVLIVKA
jgi:hypothetical protein